MGRQDETVEGSRKQQGKPPHGMPPWPTTHRGDIGSAAMPRCFAKACCLLTLVACREGPSPPPSRSRGGALATDAVAHAPTMDGPRAPGRSSPPLEWVVLSRTAWASLAPGARWAKATVRLTPTPDRAHPGEGPRTLTWVTVRLEVSQVEVTVEATPHKRLEPLAERLREALLVTNSGFFEPDDSPSGVVISGGVVRHGPGPRGGSGVLTVGPYGVSVRPIDTRDGGSFTHDGDVITAVQCGPRLVEADGSPGIYRHDGRFAARTVACVRDGGRTLDLTATWDVSDGMRGPELYDLALLLAGPSPLGDHTGCESALNLDGGPSTGIFLRALATGHMVFRHAPLRPTPWAIVVRAKPTR